MQMQWHEWSRRTVNKLVKRTNGKGDVPEPIHSTNDRRQRRNWKAEAKLLRLPRLRTATAPSQEAVFDEYVDAGVLKKGFPMSEDSAFFLQPIFK